MPLWLEGVNGGGAVGLKRGGRGIGQCTSGTKRDGGTGAAGGWN